MLDVQHLVAFIGASLVLLLTPGPAVLFVVTRTIEMGGRAGFVSTLGLAAGGLIHVFGAALGISAIIAASAQLFMAIKFLGAGYLIYLGIKSLATHHANETDFDKDRPSSRRLFLQAFGVNVMNPKPALFFVAFLPQFVDPGKGSVAGQLLALGLVFVCLGTITDSGYTLLAGSIRQALRRDARIWQVQRMVSGVVYIGLGIWAAVGGRRAPDQLN